MFHLKKLPTEFVSPTSSSNRMRAKRRLAFLLGTAAAIATPVAFAEEADETRPIDASTMSVPVVPKSAQPRSATEQAKRLPLATAEPKSGDAPLSVSVQVPSNSPTFYMLDTPAPQPSSSRNEQPSRIDAFNENQSKVVTIELAATYQGRKLGLITVETTLTRVLNVEASQLRAALEPYVDESTQLLLSQFRSGFVSVERLQAIGVTARLDPATLTLTIEAPPKKEGPLDMNLGGREAPEGTQTADAANFAAGLTSTFLFNEDFEDANSSTLSTSLSGFVNYGGVRGLNLDYGGILTFDDGTGESRFDADRTILFMDRPEHALRFEAGTLYTPLSELAGENDFLGVGITKSYRRLQPTRVLRPLGQRSFELNRASEVTVLVDGQEISRFDAPAGAVNLNDIPLANISNRVSIVVEDEFGRRETQSFSVASDAMLLQPGLSEYSFGIGQKRDRNRSGFTYTDDVVAAGNYSFGLNSNLTLGAFGYASEELSVVGTQSVFGLLDGIAQLELGYSDSETSGNGLATSLDYRWNSSPNAVRSQNFAFAFDYRDRNFTTAGSQFGVGIKYDASAFYELQLTNRLRMNLSGTYSEDYYSDTAAKSIALGSSYQFGHFFFGAGVRVGSDLNGDDDVGGFVTLTRRFGDRGSANARYDTRSDRASLRYRRPARDEVGSFGYEAELSSRDQDVSLRGAADYTANRYRTRVSFTQLNRDNDAIGDDSRLTARFQTGIAFADGQFGIGRDPGRGFVMVDKHESLDGARTTIKARGRRAVKATSGLLGPAIARVNSPYVPTTIPVDVLDAPIGYNVGEGAYYVVPGARSGIKITIGNDAFRSVVATFVAYDEPLKLTAGTITNKTTGDTQVTFTNNAGRALVSNLTPGEYLLEFAGTDFTFEFAVDEDTEAFSDLGLIDLTQGDS
ncbi:fimbria/pilus outer membrane usher protein [Henriciella sp. AS95]|uniref:fimbria/pilus outer membrane usher protein n=1 Tax=Henriciella sp. AS95 TaxID=3135782 RepID=UPI0031735C2D